MLRIWVASMVALATAGTAPGELVAARLNAAAPTTAPTAAVTTAPTTATISAARSTLNVRSGPSTAHRVVGEIADGARVAVICQVYGQSVRGPQRRTGHWDRLSSGGYVSDAYVRWRPARPTVRWCGAGGLRVTPFVAGAGGPVDLRSGPGSRFGLSGRASQGAALVVRCQRWGEQVRGPRGASHAWVLLSSRRYIADALVGWRPSRPMLPWCGQSPPTVAPATPARFISRVARPARLSMRRYRVPASVTIAQAILESGWGRSALTRRDHNYFGIKCKGDPGPIAVGCRGYPTSECGGGRCWRTRAQFRAYRDIAGSMADHGRFLAVSPRYDPAFRHTGNANRFARAIHRAGYATSPTYARKLIRIMREHRLYRYNR